MKNRPHHFYKASADTEVGKQLQALMDKCDEVSEQARQWAEAHGATSYLESPEGIAGGIAALERPTPALPLREGEQITFDTEKWDRVETPQGEVYYLPKEGSLEEQEMYALPIVSETEFIAILQFKPRVNSKGKQMPFTFGSSTPVCFRHMGYWFMDMPYECQAADLKPCTEKEFYRRRMAATNMQPLSPALS